MENCINCGERAFFYEETNRARTFCDKECQINGKYRDDPKGGIMDLWKIGEDYIRTKNPRDRDLMLYIIEDLTWLTWDENHPRRNANRYLSNLDKQVRGDQIDMKEFRQDLLNIAHYFGVRLPRPLE